MYRAMETANKSLYGVPTLPNMLSAATDMAFLRAKGVQCYGVAPPADQEDILLGYGSHSDQERIREESVYQFLRFQWDVLSSTAFRKSVTTTASAER